MRRRLLHIPHQHQKRFQARNVVNLPWDPAEVEVGEERPFASDPTARSFSAVICRQDLDSDGKKGRQRRVGPLHSGSTKNRYVSAEPFAHSLICSLHSLIRRSALLTTRQPKRMSIILSAINARLFLIDGFCFLSLGFVFVDFFAAL